MPKFDEDFAKWPDFSGFTKDQKISPEFARYLDELVERYNFIRIRRLDGTNPNNVLIGDSTQLCQDGNGDLWIKTVDGGDNGWSKVGLQT